MEDRCVTASAYALTGRERVGWWLIAVGVPLMFVCGIGLIPAGTGLLLVYAAGPSNRGEDDESH